MHYFKLHDTAFTIALMSLKFCGK